MPLRFLQKNLNKLRYLSLSLVFFLLILLPCISLYQNFALAHAYDLLDKDQKFFYDIMFSLTSPFTNEPSEALKVSGTTWSAEFWGYKVSDPLAVLTYLSNQVYYRSGDGQDLALNMPFILTAAIPFLLSIFIGRYFCAWICPASLMYELNNNLSLLLRTRLENNLSKYNLINKNTPISRQIKYWVLGLGLTISAVFGISVFTLIYPPLLVGRELFYGIALSGFSSGALFLLASLVFDFLFAQRGFCRYLCPGGALYSLLGRFRLLRVQREVSSCTNCTSCIAVCEFGLNPMTDSFGQECTNCTACIASCPTDSLSFNIKWKDQAYQGDGHQSRTYKANT